MLRSLSISLFTTVLLSPSVTAFANDLACDAGPRPASYCTCTYVDDRGDGIGQQCVKLHTYEMFANTRWIERSTIDLVCFGTADSSASQDQLACANFLTSRACLGDEGGRDHHRDH